MVSANLLVELNGTPLAPGDEYALNVGSQIHIGPFVLAVETADAIAAPASVGPGTAPVVVDPVGDDAFSLWAAHKEAGRPSVFHDVLNVGLVERRAKPRVPFDSRFQPVDLVVGEGTGSGASGAQRVPATAAAADELFGALYAGLGIKAPARAERSVAQMALVGALLRAAIGGALGLLAARGIAKRELGASSTLIQTRQNNPLKFATDVDAALAQLLEPPQRGFIPALTAVHETFDGLRAHEVAMVAGMRAALEAVLERFDPAMLEQRLADKGMWENLLPANRKAKLWDRFAEQHAQTVRDIDDNFDSVFADAFSVAYEEQLARLTKAR
jgi:type VI secretion system FHA domain protein